MEHFLRNTCQTITGAPLETRRGLFSTIGMESLRAIQMRRVIQDKLFLASKQLDNNVVYEFGNARNLARHLYSLSQGVDSREVDKEALLEEMTARYSQQIAPPRSSEHLWDGAPDKPSARETVVGNAQVC